MSKNSFLNHKLLSKTGLAVFFALCILVGLLCSRAIASVAMILFGMNAIRDVHPREWLKQRWWLLGLVWIALYAVSGLWSVDKEYWWTRLQTKLPFLLLPLAFGFLPAFSRKQVRVFTAGVCLLLLSGICYSLSFLARDPEFYIKGYGFSKVLPTPAYNDHISFSMAVTLGIVWCFYVFPQLVGLLEKWFVIISASVFILYLHVLAAKTGVVGFYVFIILVSGYYMFTGRIMKGLAVIALVAGVFFTASRFIPTFVGRLYYVLYSYEQFQSRNMSGDYGDIGRLMSYEIALKIIGRHPVAGVGAGDILHEMDKGYSVWHPQVRKEQRLIPHNQFLVTGVAAGIPCFIAFAWWFAAPLRKLRRNRESFYFFAVWMLALILLSVDPILEVQFGVLVFLFFFLFQKHALERSWE